MLATTDWKTVARKTIQHKEFLIAVSDGNFEEMNRLIEEGIDINFKDQDGHMAIFIAIEHSDSTVVKFLVDKGANLNVQNNNQETPFEIAKRMKRSDIIDILDNEKSQNSQNFASNAVAVPVSNEPMKFESTVQKNKGYTLINPVHGNIYQLKFLMLFLYRGVACKYSFKLGTEIKEARKFDDLVFEYTQSNTKVYRLLQVKHKLDESKKITVDKLLSETNGDYSLVKYYYSYQASKKDDFFKDGLIKDVTICTNIDFDFPNLKEANIEVYQLKGKDDILDLKSNEKQPMRYKFSNSMIPMLAAKLKNCKFNQRIGTSNDDVEDFLQHLVFAVNQPNEEELGSIVKAEIGKEWDFITTENVYNKSFVRMLDWMKGRSAFITYIEGQELIENVTKGIFMWFNVQDPVESFTGRLEQLQNIHENLQTKRNSMICVSGLGGVGKSELVRKYIADYGHYYDNKIIWINAESYQTLSDSFSQLACEKLGIETNNANGERKEINTLVAESYQYFSSGKSLFIFDNAEKYKSLSQFDCGIEPFLPSLPSNCIKPYILVTSRNQKWPKNAKVLVLQAFSEEEATKFVFESLQLRSEQKEYALELGKRLELLPLALQQAVAYISAQNDKLSNIGSSFQINDYFEKFSESSQESFNFEFTSDCENRYTKTVLTTWNVTLNVIKEKKNGRDALDILKIMSYLLPDNISIDLLLIFMQNKDKLASALELLKQYSLITVEHKVCNLHRLVQRVIRMKLAKENNEETTLKKILAVIKRDTINSKNVDHFISIWSHSKKYLELVKIYHHCPLNSVDVLIVYYRIAEAKSIINEVAELLKKLPSDDINVQCALTFTRNKIAKIYLQQGKYEIALREFEKVYEMQIGILRTSTSLNLVLATEFHIALALTLLGKTDEALERYRKIIKKYSVALGDNHLEILTVKGHMADVLTKTEKYEEALKVLEEVYKAQKSIFEDNNVDILRTRNSMGVLLLDQGKFEAALKIFQDIINIHGKNLPEIQVLAVRMNIALSLRNLGKYDEALKIYGDTFEIRKKLLGDHPDILNNHCNIALALRGLGKLDKALRILLVILDKQRAVFGYYHPRVLRTQIEIANILREQEDFSEAMKIYQELLKAPVQLVPSLYAEIHENLSHIALEQGKIDKSLEHRIELCKCYESTFGVNHPKTLECQNNVSQLKIFKNNPEEYLKILREAQKKEEGTTLEKDHEDYVNENRQETPIRNSARSEVEDPFMAIKIDDLSALKKLVKKNVDINMQDKYKRTLLHHAASMNRLEIVKFLLKNECDMSRLTDKGNTALHIAVAQGNNKIVEELLANISHDKWRAFINAKTTTTGSTAMHVAAKNGFHDIVKLLMIRGATYDMKNIDGKKPIDLAKEPTTIALLNKIEKLFELARSGKKECYDDLCKILEKGCLDNMREILVKDRSTLCASILEYPTAEYLAYINTRNCQGYNLIQFAIVKNHQQLVKYLGQATTNAFRNIYSLPIFNGNLLDLLPLAPNASTISLAKNCDTAFALNHVRKLVAAFREKDKRILDSNILMIEELLELIKFCKGDKSSHDLAVGVTRSYVVLFETSIHTLKMYEAAKQNDWTTVGACISKHANAIVTDRGGWTPLLFAVNAGNEKMVKLLLEYDPRVIVGKTLTGKNTSLHIAVNKGHFNIVKLLLEINKTREFLDAKTEAKGSTAVHIAAKIGRLDIVLLLLTNGATYCLRNKDGQLPVDLASDDSIKKFFKLVDELFLDAKNGRTEVIKKLEALKREEFLAVTYTSNEEEFPLYGVAAIKQHKELGLKILELSNQVKDKEIVDKN